MSDQPRQEYVVGFLHGGEQVVLIRKNRPEWQAGKLNGVGGKVEPGELPHEAMVREFAEETGVEVREWDHLLTLDCLVEERPTGLVHFFRAFEAPEVIDHVMTQTDEEVVVCWLENLADGSEGTTVPNLSWLIPFSAYEHDRFAPFVLQEISTTMAKEGRDG